MNAGQAQQTPERVGPSLPLQVAFPSERYSRAVLALILEKSQEWECSPAEAETRLLDQLAAENRPEPVSA